MKHKDRSNSTRSSTDTTSGPRSTSLTPNINDADHTIIGVDQTSTPHREPPATPLRTVMP